MHERYEVASKTLHSAVRSMYRAGAIFNTIGVASGMYGVAQDKPFAYFAATSFIFTGSILMGISHYTKKAVVKTDSQVQRTLEDLTQ